MNFISFQLPFHHYPLHSRESLKLQNRIKKVSRNFFLFFFTILFFLLSFFQLSHISWALKDFPEVSEIFIQLDLQLVETKFPIL